MGSNPTLPANLICHADLDRSGLQNLDDGVRCLDDMPDWVLLNGVLSDIDLEESREILSSRMKEFLTIV